MILAPTKSRRRKPSMIGAFTMVLASLLLILTPLAARAQTESAGGSSVSLQLEKLAAALRATQQQVEQSQQQIQQMQAEIDRLRALLAVKDTQPPPPAAPVTSPVPATSPAAAADAPEKSEDSEEIDVLKSASAQQQQTKVESSSRFPVRVTGLVLFNFFVNQGAVDQIDLPSSALLPSTTSLETCRK